MKQHEKIKNYLLKIKNTVQRSRIFEFLFIVLIFIFLFLNLVSSQFVSPLYLKIVNNDKTAIVSFLQKIKNLPEYQNVLEMNDNIYRQTIKTEIAMFENKKKVMITDLERQLTINPRSRDILYSLYQLNSAQGDKNRASYYLKLAKDIDPSIK